ncbi:DUF411 domain-containing protein [Lyngbya confervoides]|uniref:DUF411 domain-containing protein n=1 Tax=Lyngbya confervoides BDU141951 TaxID=1574623 RepID=A0ABD4T6E2_9CYAN|nr:DUF411 domain-containing protein [Lyngbya confervoides]MCM1983800.1 DUF411 domain-containing protein [Lyngbya confervoides BDU141951]
MANTPFPLPWLRFGSAILVAGGIGIGAYSLLVPADVPHPVIAEVRWETLANSLPPEARQITTYRSPTCGCCGSWVEHMQAQGFQVQDKIVDNLEGVKRDHNVPEDLAACHTAIVDGYVIEGHVPAADVKRLLTEKPKVVGIAVPGMPLGSPGMESGNIREPYQVFTFDQAGKTAVFAEHNT